MNRKLLLDKDYTFGVIFRAYVDGYSQPYSENILEHPYSKEVLSLGGNALIQRDLLSTLLLYDHIEIEPFDNFVLYTLGNKQVYPRSEMESIVRVGRSVLVRDSGAEVKKYLDLVPPEMVVDLLYDRLVKRDRLKIDREGLIKALKEDIPSSYDEIREKYYDLFSEAIEPQLEPLFRELLGDNYQTKPLDSVRRKKIDQDLSQIKNRYLEYETIASSYTYIVKKLINCDLENADLRSSFVPSHVVDVKPSGLDLVKSNRDELSALAAVMFHNMPWVRPKNYEDFLKLSEHKNIEEFRNFFHESLEDIKEGKITLEDLVQKANRASEVVKRIESATKVDNISFWLSIPIGILSSFVLSPVSGASVSVALASPKLYTFVEKRRYRWALVDVRNQTA